MKALSSLAALKPQTTYKYNAGTNLESDFDVDYYETYFRNYDPQIGRFTGIDALSEETMSMTTYQFGADNPVILNDPDGLYQHYEEHHYDPITYNVDPTNWGVPTIDEVNQINGNLDWDDPRYSDFGSGGGGSGGGYTISDNGIDIYGGAASATFSALVNAYEHPNDDGDWHLSLGAWGANNGDLGFWEPYYPGYSSSGNSLTVSTHFVSWGDFGGPGKKTSSNSTSNGVDGFKTGLDALDLSYNLTDHSLIGAQRLANGFGGTSEVITDVGKLKLLKGITVKGGFEGLGYIALATDLYDMKKNGINWTNGTDAVMGGIALWAPGPGWLIGGAYFLSNMIVEHYTGNSVGYYIGQGWSAFSKAVENDPILNSGNVRFNGY